MLEGVASPLVFENLQDEEADSEMKVYEEKFVHLFRRKVWNG